MVAINYMLASIGFSLVLAEQEFAICYLSVNLASFLLYLSLVMSVLVFCIHILSKPSLKILKVITFS